MSRYVYCYTCMQIRTTGPGEMQRLVLSVWVAEGLGCCAPCGEKRIGLSQVRMRGTATVASKGESGLHFKSYENEANTLDATWKSSSVWRTFRRRLRQRRRFQEEKREHNKRRRDNVDLHVVFRGGRSSPPTCLS